MMVKDFVFYQKRYIIYKIPPDIENILRKKYPNIDITQVIHDVFDTILEKTFDHGSCTIRSLGKFICFKTFSTRMGRDQVRFKFKASTTFVNKIKNDSFLVDKLACVKNHNFTDYHKNNCEDKKEQKLINTQIEQTITKQQKKKTNESLAKQKILDILKEDVNKKME